MSLPDLTYEQAKALASGGYGKETLKNVGRYVVPICWPLSPDEDGERLTNGTAFLFSFGLVSGGMVADSVTETRIVTSMGRDDLVDTLGHGLPPEDFDFRGMSGGPVLATIETNVVSWFLAGVISEGTSFMGGILFADAATCIQDDGTIRE